MSILTWSGMLLPVSIGALATVVASLELYEAGRIIHGWLRRHSGH